MWIVLVNMGHSAIPRLRDVVAYPRFGTFAPVGYARSSTCLQVNDHVVYFNYGVRGAYSMVTTGPQGGVRVDAPQRSLKRRALSKRPRVPQSETPIARRSGRLRVPRWRCTETLLRFTSSSVVDDRNVINVEHIDHDDDRDHDHRPASSPQPRTAWSDRYRARGPTSVRLQQPPRRPRHRTPGQGTHRRRPHSRCSSTTRSPTRRMKMWPGNNRPLGSRRFGPSAGRPRSRSSAACHASRKSTTSSCAAGT